jgi:hypothetical protein
VQTLHGCLAGQFPSRTLVTIAGHGCTDRTGEMAAAGCTPARGSGWYGPDSPAGGGALAKVRASSQAEVLAYTDAGPSTALSAVLPLVAPAWLLPAASRSCPA